MRKTEPRIEKLARYKSNGCTYELFAVFIAGGIVRIVVEIGKQEKVISVEVVEE